MAVSVERVAYRVTDMPLRIPFEYGSVRVTERPLLFVVVDAAVDGTSARGIASETMAPQWFVKGESFDASLDMMVDVLESARGFAVDGGDEPTVFDWWRRLYDRQREWGESTAHPPLLWAFGAAVLERATIDAFCRAKGVSFGRAVREGRLGIDLGEVHRELAGAEPAEFLPAEPSREVAVRHTVGHGDPLVPGEIAPENRAADGLPQALSEYVEDCGISYFKIKLSGDPDADVERAAAVADVLSTHCDGDYRVTFDANEGYESVAALRSFWEGVRSRPDATALVGRTLVIEQPLPRSAAMTDETAAALSAWTDGPPVIIDESDDRLDSLPRALEHGYAGTSHKNCKGVVKGIANACLLAHRREEDGDTDREYVMTAEDLLTVGPVALLQDLAAVATLGPAHAERNGHHYVKGLSAVPESMADAVLDAHGDLYHRHEEGFATLTIADGSISLDSVVDAPFGVSPSLSVSRFPALAEWLEARG